MTRQVLVDAEARKVERMQRVLFILLGELAPVHLVKAAIKGEDEQEELQEWVLKYSHERFPWASGIDVMDAAQQIATSWCDKRFEDTDLPALTQPSSAGEVLEHLKKAERALLYYEDYGTALRAVQAALAAQQPQPGPDDEEEKLYGG